MFQIPISSREVWASYIDLHKFQTSLSELRWPTSLSTMGTFSFEYFKMKTHRLRLWHNYCRANPDVLTKSNRELRDLIPDIFELNGNYAPDIIDNLRTTTEQFGGMQSFCAKQPHELNIYCAAAPFHWHILTGLRLPKHEGIWSETVSIKEIAIISYSTSRLINAHRK